MDKRRVDEYVDRFNLMLDSFVDEATDSDLTPAKKAERRKLADKNDFEFSKIYFPTIFSSPWNDIHKYIESIKHNSEYQIYTCSGSRFYGKSAFSYITKVIKPICIGGLGLIGIGLRTEDDAKERTAAIKRLIVKNKKLCYDYSIQIQQDKKGDYIINQKSLKSFGYREGIRNVFDEEFKRFETIILDDVFNRQSVTSEKDNEKVYNFVTAEVSGQLNPGGIAIWLFNYVAPNSPGKKYADEHPETHFNLPALNKKGQTNWPGSFWTTEELLNKKESIPLDVWMGDWMNDPILRGDIFKPEWLNFVNINLIKIVASITAIDPSHGQSPSACAKGIVTMGQDDKNKNYILDIKISKEDYMLIFDYLDSVRSSFSAHKAILFENDFNQWNFAYPYYLKWIELRKKYLPIINFSTKSLETEIYGTDKDSRIMNLVNPFEMNDILINLLLEHKQDYLEWRTQYLSFGKSKEKLDGLDATATAFIMLPRYVITGSFKPLAKRQHGINNKEGWLHGR